MYITYKKNVWSHSGFALRFITVDLNLRSLNKTLTIGSTLRFFLSNPFFFLGDSVPDEINCKLVPACTIKNINKILLTQL